MSISLLLIVSSRCTAVCVGAYLLQQGIEGLHKAGVSTSPSDLAAMGLGKFSIASAVGTDYFDSHAFYWNFLGNVLLVNLPQTFLSFLFLFYNGMFTCFLVGQEWTRLALIRQPLRVSNPKFTQRSTQRLGLPYPYGLFTIFVSITLHWLMSQSLFLANLAFYSSDGRFIEHDYVAGYSCIGIIASLAVGSAAVLVGILMSLRRYDVGMPVVRSSSAAIAAACHPVVAEPSDMIYKPLQWGVVSTDEEGISHCAFSLRKLVCLPTHEFFDTDRH